MSGGGKGSQTVEQKMDPQAMAMIQEMSAFGKQVAKMPYMPWQGLDVAAFTPQQVGGMQAFADMGNAFGMGMPTNVMKGLPKPTTDSSGVSGFSAYPMYQDAAKKSAIAQPEAAARYADFFDMPVSSLFGGEGAGTYDPAVARASAATAEKPQPSFGGGKALPSATNKRGDPSHEGQMWQSLAGIL